jgi:hypothetical protein
MEGDKVHTQVGNSRHRGRCGAVSLTTEGHPAPKNAVMNKTGYKKENTERK